MALPHLQPGCKTDLADDGTVADGAQPFSVALFKARQLEVVRFHLRPGQRLPRHSVPGEITIQCLSGCVAVTHGSELEHEVNLNPNELMLLSGGVPHALHVEQDSVFLVTIALTA